MKKKSPIILIIILIILLMPVLFKKRINRSVTGPSLDSLKYKEVGFRNKYDGTNLGGMLFLPDRIETFPIAIIIQGSGTSNRQNSWYLTIASHLQKNGIGVLLPDKRGNEKSGGDWRGVSLETLAMDTESAIDFIRNKRQFEKFKLGVIGMSQGGWIAPIVASKIQDLSFVINMSGAMTSTNDQLLFEEYNNIAPYTYNFIARFISPMTTNNLKKRKAIASLMDFDPIPYWKKINSPVFIAYGENDKNCPVNQNVERIKKERLQHFKVKIYPGEEMVF